MDDDVIPAGEPDPYAERAAERAFPSRLPAPGMGGGSELGEMVQLYSTEERPFRCRPTSSRRGCRWSRRSAWFC